MLETPKKIKLAPKNKFKNTPNKNLSLKKNDLQKSDNKIKNNTQNFKSNSPGQLPINDPRHLALIDSKGNIYPNSLGVDGEYVVAYGDIIVGESRYIQDYESGDKVLKVNRPQVWPSRRIPYRIAGDITEAQKRAIENIATKLAAEVQLSLTPYDPYKDKAYVHFKKGSQHCYAQVGYSGEIAEVALNERCGQTEIFHEVFHVLGFFHEQNRFDRDDHIKILWENIDEKNWPQFEKFPEESFPEIFINQAPFTFNTLMLYRPNAFSENSDYSIVNIYGEAYKVISEPTKEDYRRIMLLYQDITL